MASIEAQRREDRRARKSDDEPPERHDKIVRWRTDIRPEIWARSGAGVGTD
jgi:hypothetical protein